MRNSYYFFCLIMMGFAIGYRQPAVQVMKPALANKQRLFAPATASSLGTSSATSVRPIRLVIPAIDVSASIEAVGIVANGDLATPTQQPWTDVGWYKTGPYPGGRGSAVIDGHLDRPGGIPAVFWLLNKLQVNDDIQVVNAAGSTLHYRVLRTVLYAPQVAPLQAIFGDMGGQYLNLITCAGDWMPDQHQTTLRLVVYTVFG